MEQNFKKYKKWTIIGVVILFLIIVLCNSIATVSTGFVGVKSRFGAVQPTMINEGFNFKVPFIESIVSIDCRTQKCEYNMEASSKDLQKINSIKVAINYNVDKTGANDLYKEVGVDFKTIIIEPAIFESVKSVFADFTAEELITKRAEVSNKILETLSNKLQAKGITVTALNLTDLSFSAEFDAAIEKKQVIEQQTKAAQYELEKAKIENERKINEAKANAEVMKVQNQEITDKALDLKRIELQTKLIEKWNGALPQYQMSDTIPFLNMK